MSFTAPRYTAQGRLIRDEPNKEALEVGQRCLVCFETCPQAYAACDKGHCYPVGASKPEREAIDLSGFVAPAPLVSAYDLAARMTAKALALGWDDEEQAGRLLRRAKELRTGDSAEVPDEEF